MRIALYEPDIAANAASVLRLAACLGVGVDVIEPLGFVWGDQRMRRVGMDYLGRVEVRRHVSWTAFRESAAGRLVLLTTAGATPLPEMRFEPSDILLLGRESAGVPPEVHEAVGQRVRIPLRAGLRSLNVAMAAAIVLGEALRQTDGWP